MALHSSTRRHKTVWVRLRTGEEFLARFKERTRQKWLVFYDRPRVHVREVSAFSDRPYRQS